MPPKYYQLVGQSGPRLYVDGSPVSDYPDFHSISLFDAGLLSKLIKRCDFQAALGPGFSFSVIVDRFGNWYWSVGVSGGIGVSLASYTEGYVVTSAHSSLLRGNSTLITNSEQMQGSIQGLSGGASASVFYGAGGLAGLWWAGEGGAGVLSFSMGLQAGISGDLVLTRYLDTKPELSWNWAVETQLGVYPWVQPTFRSDVEQKAQHFVLPR